MVGKNAINECIWGTYEKIFQFETQRKKELGGGWLEPSPARKGSTELKMLYTLFEQSNHQSHHRWPIRGPEDLESCTLQLVPKPEEWGWPPGRRALDRKAMEANLKHRMKKLGGPVFLPEIIHSLGKSMCKEQTCKCGDLFDVAQEVVVNWLEQGAPSTLQDYGFLKTMTPNNPNRLEMWWQW